MTTLEKYKIIVTILGRSYTKKAKNNNIPILQVESYKALINFPNAPLIVEEIKGSMITKKHLKLANEVWREVYKLYRDKELDKVFASSDGMGNNCEMVTNLIKKILKST